MTYDTEPEPADQTHLCMCWQCGSIVEYDDYQEPDMFCVQCGGMIYNV